MMRDYEIAALRCFEELRIPWSDVPGRARFYGGLFGFAEPKAPKERVVAIVQARLGSSRLPGKVMLPLGGEPVLSWVVKAAKEATSVDHVIVAYPSSDEKIGLWCSRSNVDAIDGPELDVLARFRLAAEQAKADIVVRLTADCPFLDPALINACVKGGRGATTQYWPDGLDVQVFHAFELERGDHEHIVGREIRLPQLPCPEGDLRSFRVTLDTPADYMRMRAMVPFLPNDRPPTWRETINALRQVEAAA